MVQYTQLHTTCSEMLPVEPLLRAVIRCTHGQPNSQVPTFSIESGSCRTTNDNTCVTSPNFDGASAHCASPVPAHSTRQRCATHTHVRPLATTCNFLSYKLSADADNEDCIIHISSFATLSSSVFQTEQTHDVLTIGDQSFSGDTGPQGVYADSDTTITWVTDLSVQNIGFEVCATAQ